MEISLLFSATQIKTGEIGEQVLSHCALDRFAERICGDEKRRSCFLDILQHPLLEEKDILYRRAILEDLKDHPNTEPALREWAEEFDRLIRAQQSARRDIRRSEGSDRDAVTAANNIRITLAIGLKRGILFLQKALEILKDDYTSEGINLLKQNLHTAAYSEETDRILLLCGQIENTLLSENSYRITLSPDGTVEECVQLCEPIQPKEEKKRFSLFRKEATPSPHRASASLSAQILEGAVRESARMLDSICEELFSCFGKIGRELSFYRTALEYITALQEKGIPLSYPKIATETALKAVYDPYLCLTEPNPVPNDCNLLSGKGTLIFGRNSGGKTVFLRSVMAAHILTQGGIPVPAAGAIHPYTVMESVFAEAEEKDHGAGRFEQEARTVAELLDRIRPNTLLCFNEPFQTTAPKEGAEGLKNILHHLTEIGVDWIAVTHLTDLKSGFDSDTRILMAGEGYCMTEEKE